MTHTRGTGAKLLPTSYELTVCHMMLTNVDPSMNVVDEWMDGWGEISEGEGLSECRFLLLSRSAISLSIWGVCKSYLSEWGGV